MSDTDKTDPIWVRLNDHRRDVRAAHSYRCHGSGGAACDLPPWPVDRHRREAECRYRPAGELWERVYRGSYTAAPSRQPFRREWFASERAAQRAILRNLTRTANSGGEIDEDRIDNPQTHRYATYGGGWWD